MEAFGDVIQDSKFRINRCSVGLTYSCPTDKSENPIVDHKELITFLATKGSIKKYTTGRELHEKDEAAGKIHWHVFVVYDDEINTKNCRFFDFKGVHPNILKGKPGKGWEAYCVKHADFVSNYWKVDVFQTVWAKRTWAEARDMLKESVPKFLLQHGHTAERNFKRFKSDAKRGPTIYYGPYRKELYEICKQHDWTKTMVIKGPPGYNKTQFLKYWCASYFYAKGKCLDKLRECEDADYEYLILDDASKMLNEMDSDDQNSVLDVENGGDVNAKYRDVCLPPSRRVIVANRPIEWKVQAAPELKRRFKFYTL
jgi:hypothetical protein